MTDFRPTPQSDQMMKGDSWAKLARVSRIVDGSAAPVDLTGYVITTAFKPSDGSATTQLDVATTPEGLVAGEFWYGQNSATKNGQWEIILTPSGGLPRTYYRGSVTLTNGAGDA